MKYVDRFIEALISVAYGVVVLLAFGNVFSRYVLNNSIVWSEELGRYLFIWIVFLAAPLGINKGVHISVDFFIRLFPPRMQKAIIIIHSFLIAIFFVIIFVPSIEVVRTGMGNSSLSLEIPMGIIYLAFPVGWGLIALNFLRITVQQLRSEHHRQNF